MDHEMREAHGGSPLHGIESKRMVDRPSPRAAGLGLGDAPSTRTSRILKHILSCFLGAALLTLLGCQPGQRQAPPPPPAAHKAHIRAIWVTRWDFKTVADVQRVMENCKRAGFNTVLFQVRGNGTALYRSRIEPWADELGGRDPGFDPLAVACAEAHKRGLALHAWVNVMPGWRGKEPPRDRRQLYHAHPDWFWRDAQGRRQPLGWYQSLNPCYPEVRRYIVSVMHEIVARYPIDGLHMDYIRFPNEWNASYPRGASVPDYPRDARTLAMFRKATGQSPEGAPRQWNDWRTAQVTQVVRDIRRMIAKTKPRVKLTAAVGSEPKEARRNHFQDSRGWIAAHLLDAVYPMNYAADHALFDRRVGAWASTARDVPVVMGIMFDGRSPGSVNRQMAKSVRGGGHFAAFAYNSLFERPGKGGSSAVSAAGKRRALRDGVIPHIRRLATNGRVAGR